MTNRINGQGIGSGNGRNIQNNSLSDILAEALNLIADIPGDTAPLPRVAQDNLPLNEPNNRARLPAVDARPAAVLSGNDLVSTLLPHWSHNANAPTIRLLTFLNRLITDPGVTGDELNRLSLSELAVLIFDHLPMHRQIEQGSAGTDCPITLQTLNEIERPVYVASGNAVFSLDGLLRAWLINNGNNPITGQGELDLNELVKVTVTQSRDSEPRI